MGLWLVGVELKVGGEIWLLVSVSRFCEVGEVEAHSGVTGKALIASAAMWETLSEVDVKLAKAVQKEYETANDLAGKFFKKIAVRYRSLLFLCETRAD